MLVTIIIPFYNEKENLRVLLPHILNVTGELPCEFEIILIDDASEDGSADIVKDLQCDYPCIRLLQLEKRSGQTGCYKIAFANAKGDYIIRMDADLQDNPADLPLFINKIQEGAELIMGLRECRKHSRLMRIASGIYDLLIIVLFNSPLHSNSGSYVAFKVELVKDIPFHKNDHRYLPLIAMRRGAKNISEVFVGHRERQFGDSKYNPFRKVVFGIPEVILFLLRYTRGVYDVVE